MDFGFPRCRDNLASIELIVGPREKACPQGRHERDESTDVQDRTREKTRKRRRIKADPNGSVQIIPGQEVIRREKEKARHLRQSAWWTRKIREGVCYYCREKVGSKNLTMDHVIPLSRGGKSLKGNIVPCCKECNNRKKHLIPVEWEEYLKRLSVMNQDKDLDAS